MIKVWNTLLRLNLIWLANQLAIYHNDGINAVSCYRFRVGKRNLVGWVVELPTENGEMFDLEILPRAAGLTLQDMCNNYGTGGITDSVEHSKFRNVRAPHRIY